MDDAQWFDIATESQVRSLFAAQGVKSFYLKALKRNHNSKNQIYLAPDLSELALLPTGEVTSNTGTSEKPGAGGAIFHAPVAWFWIQRDGSSAAPLAQLIYYPQYPEVRLSGLLQGSPLAPRDLLSIETRGQESGRLLLFGSDGAGSIFAQMVSGKSPAGQSLANLVDPAKHIDVFPVDTDISVNADFALVTELARIYRLGWVDSCELHSDGTLRPCAGPRCGGHTLEAQMGIPMNGTPAPDFGEWEVKSHKVGRFDRPAVGRVTLFTPEPNEGAYVEHGVSWFAEHFGRFNEAKNRYDFTGVHAVSDEPQKVTGLHMELDGYDASTRELKADGMIALVSGNGELVSGWTFAKLLQHWQRKHALAAYVPVLTHSEKPVRFSYGNLVHLARHTRFELFLRAMSEGQVVYDPGIKSELQPNGTWKGKARSQFRIDFKSLHFLYETFDEVDVIKSA